MGCPVPIALVNLHLAKEEGLGDTPLTIAERSNRLLMIVWTDNYLYPSIYIHFLVTDEVQLVFWVLVTFLRNQ